MSPIELLIRVAAAHRLTRLVVEDEVTRGFRDAVASNYGHGSKASYLVNCSYCVSVWAGALSVVLPRRVAGALALSSGTIAAKWVAEVAEAAVARRNQ